MKSLDTHKMRVAYLLSVVVMSTVLAFRHLPESTEALGEFKVAVANLSKWLLGEV
tara:strand:- start:708 stop:872 length:165 start_codon:yes stop_codon:yes gene_type:complete